MNKKRIRQMSASLLLAGVHPARPPATSPHREMLRECWRIRNSSSASRPSTTAARGCSRDVPPPVPGRDGPALGGAGGGLAGPLPTTSARRSMFRIRTSSPAKRPAAQPFSSLCCSTAARGRFHPAAGPGGSWSAGGDELQGSPHYESLPSFLRSYRREYIYE